MLPLLLNSTIKISRDKHKINTLPSFDDSLHSAYRMFIRDSQKITTIHVISASIFLKIKLKIIKPK